MWKCCRLQEQRRSRSAFRSDPNGTARIPSTVLGQRVGDSQGEYLCLYLCLYSLYIKGVETHRCLFAAPGADSIHAGGGGGSEIHRPAGARAPLGHCKSSVN